MVQDNETNVEGLVVKITKTNKQKKTSCPKAFARMLKTELYSLLVNAALLSLTPFIILCAAALKLFYNLETLPKRWQT